MLLLLIDCDPHLVDTVIDEAITQAASARDRVDAAEIEVVRPSAVPFEVQRLTRTLTRKRRGGMSA